MHGLRPAEAQKEHQQTVMVEIIIIIIIIITINFIIIIIIIQPSEFSAIQGLKNHATCSLGILSVVIITKNRFVSISVGLGTINL